MILTTEPSKAAHDMKFVFRDTNIASWVHSLHINDLRSSWLGHGGSPWVGWMQWGQKIKNPLEINPARQLMTWNLCPGTQILRHGSARCTPMTSIPAGWAMVDLHELVGYNGGKKLEIHWKSTQQGNSWHEICALGHKFCVMSPLVAHQWPPFQQHELDRCNGGKNWLLKGTEGFCLLLTLWLYRTTSLNQHNWASKK